jgi:ribosomal protein S18 acetylase RimI-like enzyme
MKIRAIIREEIGSIKPLWESLNAHHLSRSTHFQDHFSKFTFEKRMDGLKKRERLIAYVAEDKGENVGYCIATIDGLTGEIDSLFVSEKQRGKGVGEKLISHALKWLEVQKCETIKVSIAEGNENVLGFYRRFGFAERLIVMQKNA